MKIPVKRALLTIFVAGVILTSANLAAARPRMCAQGTCGNGVCEAGESMPNCPQDCGIALVAEDFEDGQVQGWNYDPPSWVIIAEGGTHVWHAAQQAYASTGWSSAPATMPKASRWTGRCGWRRSPGHRGPTCAAPWSSAVEREWPACDCKRLRSGQGWR